MSVCSEDDDTTVGYTEQSASRVMFTSVTWNSQVYYKSKLVTYYWDNNKFYIEVVNPLRLGDIVTHTCDCDSALIVNKFIKRTTLNNSIYELISKTDTLITDVSVLVIGKVLNVI